MAGALMVPRTPGLSRRPLARSSARLTVRSEATNTAIELTMRVVSSSLNDDAATAFGPAFWAALRIGAPGATDRVGMTGGAECGTTVVCGAGGGPGSPRDCPDG